MRLGYPFIDYTTTTADYKQKDERGKVIAREERKKKRKREQKWKDV